MLPLWETLHILLDSKNLFVFIIGYICKCLKIVPYHFLTDGWDTTYVYHSEMLTHVLIYNSHYINLFLNELYKKHDYKIIIKYIM